MAFGEEEHFLRFQLTVGLAAGLAAYDLSKQETCWQEEQETHCF